METPVGINFCSMSYDRASEIFDAVEDVARKWKNGEKNGDGDEYSLADIKGVQFRKEDSADVIRDTIIGAVQRYYDEVRRCIMCVSGGDNWPPGLFSVSENLVIDSCNEFLAAQPEEEFDRLRGNGSLMHSTERGSRFVAISEAIVAVRNDIETLSRGMCPNLFLKLEGWARNTIFWPFGKDHSPGFRKDDSNEDKLKLMRNVVEKEDAASFGPDERNGLAELGRRCEGQPSRVERFDKVRPHVLRMMGEA